MAEPQAPAAAAAAPSEATTRARHQERAEARQQAKARATETPGKKRQFINTERFEGLQRFYQDTRSEIRKVNWPDRETARNLTLVVIGLSVILGVLLGGIDYVLYQLFEAMS